MPKVNLRFINVSFSFTPSSDEILSSLNLHFSAGWTGIVGPNGAGKTTLAKLAAGILLPVKGSVSGISESVPPLYCAQETEYPPENAAGLVYACDSTAGKLCSMLGIQHDWLERWPTLSHGERKRVQVGAALMENPGVLILDEPVNHLDRHTKMILVKALQTYAGTGLIISHDREILDLLCTSCLFMQPGNAVMRPGNYSVGAGLEQQEQVSKARAYHEAVEKHKQAHKSAVATKQKEQARAAGLSKKKLSRKDHDRKGRIDLARLTGKDKTGARKATLLERKAEMLQAEAGEKYYHQREVRGMDFRGQKSERNTVVLLASGSIELGPGAQLEIPALAIRPTDRIAITGDNGAGKSTLLKHIRSRIDMPAERMIYIPQEIDEAEWQGVSRELASLPGSELGQLLSVVYRLGSEPERVLQSVSPSPGEKRKILLGLGLLKTPSLIMMDEPTNHMDMPSILCLEEALREFAGALLLVSHDADFISNVTDTEWALAREGSRSRLVVKM